MITRLDSGAVCFSVVDVSTGLGKTGDTANLTIKLIRDGVQFAPTNPPAEVDSANSPGIYKIQLTPNETDCDMLAIVGKSSTANVVVIPVYVPVQPFAYTILNGIRYANTNVLLFGDDPNIPSYASDYGLVLATSKTAAEIHYAGSLRTGDAYKATAVFTKQGSVCIPSQPVTCVASFQGMYSLGGTTSIGPRITEYTLDYAVVRDAYTGAYYVYGYVAEWTQGKRGKILFKFHTDDPDVDTQDVFVEVDVNLDIYRPESVEAILGNINTATQTLGQMSVTIQSPNLTGDSFKIVSGDSYPRLGSGSAIIRPIRIQVAGVPFSLTGLSINFYLKYKNTSGQPLVTQVADIAVSNQTETSFYLEVGLTDEQTRVMVAQTDGQWEIKVFETDGVNNWRDATLASGMFTVASPIYDGATGPTPA